MVVSTMLRLVPTVGGVIAMLAIIMLGFAQLGILLFGGELRLENALLNGTAYSDGGYFAMNFNDAGSAMVTVFQLLIVNNWDTIMARQPNTLSRLGLRGAHS